MDAEVSDDEEINECDFGTDFGKDDCTDVTCLSLSFCLRQTAEWRH